MISVVQNKEVYEIRFTFDLDVLTMVKNVPGRMWHPETKIWTIPKDKLGFFLNQIKGTIYEPNTYVKSDEDLDVNASIDEKPVIPDVDISKYHYYVQNGCKPFPHQLDSLRYFLDRKRRGLRSGFILADQPGAGKTLEVTNMALYDKEYENAQHCLIICCVNGAKYNWREDIEKHTNGDYKPYILGSRIKRNGDINYAGSSQAKLDDLQSGKMYGGKGDDLPYFLIVNIEAFRMKRGRKYLFTEEVLKWINEKKISMIALDEIHTNCLDYDSLISTNLGLIKIGDIVENKLKVDVLSYDFRNNKLTYEPILEWHKNPISTDLLELCIETDAGTKILKCTPNHLIYTKNRGWVKAIDLTEYDDIVYDEGK